MELPPPKLRDLSRWIEGTKPTKVWEIGVPAKKSLSWSIVLSALLSANEESFPDILKKLTGDESEVREIKGKKKLSLSKINADGIKKKLRIFNPFKNRHNIFHQVEISEILRIFDLRLKRYANSIKSSTDEWNDDLKLKAASKFLGCKIEVYFTETGEFKRYSEAPIASPIANIILFEHTNRMHGARKDPINIFYFSMGLRQVYNLKLSALRHFLKKAKISQDRIDKVIELMNSSETHGTAFLPTIIEKGSIDILPEIYKSPYIAFKLSEAGFETDPIAGISGKPSPLCNVLLYSTNPAYLRILYDYASNCRILFDKSLRQADDTVLKNLERIINVVENDISMLYSSNLHKCSKERALHILKQLKQFIEFQFKIVNDLTDLKSKHKSKDIKTSDFQKEIISVIVTHNLHFFWHGNESDNISQQLSDFVRYTEYYHFTDNFFYLSFFDNFFKLKLLFRLKEENVLSSHVEGKIYLAIKSCEYFSTDVPLNISEDFESINENRSENILRHIPLYYRNEAKSELVSLREILNNSEDSHIEDYLKHGCNSYPEIIDEVLISRLNKFLNAVQEISLETDELLCSQFLVIERAMQVIGESIKPPSSSGSIASFLLRSCLPIKLQIAFTRIRDDLSHYRCNSVYGKLKIEKYKKFFEGIKNELKQIQVAFEIVSFTQYFRIEELVMEECLNHLNNKMELNEYEKFRKKCDFHLKQRSLDYETQHKRCIQLLLDSLSDLQEHLKTGHTKHNLHKRNIFGQLKSIEFLLEFIAKKKKEEYLNNLLEEVQNFWKENNIQHEQTQKLISTLPKWKNEILKHNPEKKNTLSTPNIESFLESMKRNIFSEDEKKQINTLVEKTLQEAIEAKCDLEGIFKKGFNKESIPEVDKLLEKIPLPKTKLAEIISSYEQKTSSTVSLKPLRFLQEESKIKRNINEMIEKNSLIDGHAHTVLTKIVFQRNSNPLSPVLPVELHEKLENFLANKAILLVNRAKILKNILIDDDEEINATWKWGRSEAIKHHLKFLMRQRYMRETTVCASLEMAYFDLLNIVHKPLPPLDEERDTRADPDNYFAMLYEKSKDLFAGFDLRNLLSHRNNFPEVIGEILDKDDFPSEMIEKILKWINDSDAVEAMLELFKKSGVIEKEAFVRGIKESNFPKEFSHLIRTIKDCDMWEEYLPYFPFVKDGYKSEKKI